MQNKNLDKFGLRKVFNPNGQFLKSVILGLCLLVLSFAGFSFGALMPNSIAKAEDSNGVLYGVEVYESDGTTFISGYQTLADAWSDLSTSKDYVIQVYRSESFSKTLTCSPSGTWNIYFKNDTVFARADNFQNPLFSITSGTVYFDGYCDVSVTFLGSSASGNSTLLSIAGGNVYFGSNSFGEETIGGEEDHGFYFSNNTSATAGAAINSSSSGTLNLRYCYFQNNTVSVSSGNAVGGAIGLTAVSGKVIVSNCEFTNNSAVTTSTTGNARGGALGIVNGMAYTITLTSSKFINNIAFTAGTSTSYFARGGALDVSATACGTTINGCQFMNNAASGDSNAYADGGAISVALGTHTITDSELSYNTAKNGGAISDNQTATSTQLVTLSGCTLEGNAASGNGGAFAYGALDATNTIFRYNTASTGGAIYAYNVTMGKDTSSSSSVESSIIGNIATSGGAIYLTGTKLSVSSTTISENYTTSSDTTSATIFVSSSTTQSLYFKSCTISKNVVQYGWAVLYHSAGSATDNSNLSIDSSSITDNYGVGLIYQYGAGSSYFCDTKIYNNVLAVNNSATASVLYRNGTGYNINFDWYTKGVEIYDNMWVNYRQEEKCVYAVGTGEIQLSGKGARITTYSASDWAIYTVSSNVQITLGQYTHDEGTEGFRLGNIYTAGRIELFANTYVQNPFTADSDNSYMISVYIPSVSAGKSLVTFSEDDRDPTTDGLSPTNWPTTVHILNKGYCCYGGVVKSISSSYTGSHVWDNSSSVASAVAVINFNTTYYYPTSASTFLTNLKTAMNSAGSSTVYVYMLSLVSVSSGIDIASGKTVYITSATYDGGITKGYTTGSPLFDVYGTLSLGGKVGGTLRIRGSSDSSNSGRLITVEGGYLEIESNVILANNVCTQSYGSGIYCEQDGTAYIYGGKFQNLAITSISDSYYGAVLDNDGYTEIYGGTFYSGYYTSSTTSDYTGLISGSETFVYGGLFIGRNASNRYYAFSRTDLGDVSGATFVNFVVGLDDNNGFSDCKFYNNTGVIGTISVAFFDCQFANNSGGVSAFTLKNNTLYNTSVTSRSMNTITWSGNKFYSNSNQYGLSITGQTLTISNNVFANNNAQFLIDYQPISTSSTTSYDISFSNNQFINNSSDERTLININATYRNLTFNGDKFYGNAVNFGSLVTNLCAASLTNVDMSYNKFEQTYSTTASFSLLFDGKNDDISGSIFNGNEVAGNLFTLSTAGAQISNSTFKYNNVADLFSINADVTFDTCTINGNVYTNNLMPVADGAALTISGGTISHNIVDSESSAYALIKLDTTSVSYGNWQFSDVEFAGNNNAIIYMNVAGSIDLLTMQNAWLKGNYVSIGALIDNRKAGINIEIASSHIFGNLMRNLIRYDDTSSNFGESLKVVLKNTDVSYNISTNYMLYIRIPTCVISGTTFDANISRYITFGKANWSITDSAFNYNIAYNSRGAAILYSTSPLTIGDGTSFTGNVAYFSSSPSGTALPYAIYLGQNGSLTMSGNVAFNTSTNIDYAGGQVIYCYNDSTITSNGATNTGTGYYSVEVATPTNYAYDSTKGYGTNPILTVSGEGSKFKYYDDSYVLISGTASGYTDKVYLTDATEPVAYLYDEWAYWATYLRYSELGKTDSSSSKINKYAGIAADFTSITFTNTKPDSYDYVYSIGATGVDNTADDYDIYATLGDYPGNIADVLLYVSGTKAYIYSEATIYFPMASNDLFYGLTKLQSIDFGGVVDTSNVISMARMFESCSSLYYFAVDGKFDTSNVTDIREMFSGCTSLVTVHLDSDFSSVTNATKFFANCTSLIRVTTPTKLGTAIDLPTDKKWYAYDNNNALQLYGSTIPTTTANEDVNAGGVVTLELNGGTLTTDSWWTSTSEICVATSGSINFPTVSKTGYTLKGWYTQASGGTKVSNVSGITNDVTYYAQWDVNSYNITIYALTGIADITQPATTWLNDSIGRYKVTTANYGTQYTITVTVNNGYTFSKWTTDSAGNTSVGTSTSLTITVGETNVYYAWATPNPYTITYNANGGTGSAQTQNVTYNSPFTTKASGTFSRTGYTFAGWSTDKSSLAGSYQKASTSYTYTTAGNTTLYAVWTANQYTLTINPNGGTYDGKTTNTTVTQNYNTTYTVANPTRTGYTFNGWTNSGSGSISGTTYTFGAGDGTLTANWTAYTYTITYNLDGGSVATANPTTYTIETADFTLNNPTKAGYKFLGWTGTELSSASTTVTISKGSTGNRTYTANWQANSYNITINSVNGTGGSVSPTTYSTSTAAQTATLTNPTKTGYTFNGWTVSWTDSSTHSGTLPTVSGTTLTIPANCYGNITLTAKWNTNSYTVTYDATTNGGTFKNASGYENTASVEYGKSVDLDKSHRYGEKSGWTFVGWNTDKSATTTQSSLTMSTNNITLYAIYSRTYTYNFIQVDGTNDSKSATIYNTATSGTITAPAVDSKSGYSIVGWGDSSTATKSSIASEATSVTINSDATYYAVYNYTVTVSYNGNGQTGGSTTNSTGTAYITAKASGTSEYNATPASITLKNNGFTKTGYQFSKWAEGSASGTQYAANATVKLSANATYYAIWTQNTATIKLGTLTNVEKVEYSTSANGSGTTLTTDGFTATSNTNYYFKATISKATGHTITFTKFSGWFEDTSNPSGAHYFTDSGTTYTVNAIASDTVNSYTLTANANGGSISATSGWTGTGTTATKKVAYGSAYGTLPTPTAYTKDGYTVTFKGWFTAASGGTQVTASTTMGADNVTIYAQYSEVDSTKPTVTITCTDYNTFSWTASDNVGVTGYAITNSSTAPTDWTTSGTLTSGSKDVTSAGTYYVWAKDAVGNTASASIVAYALTKKQGANTTLTIKENNASGATLETTAVLNGTIIYVSATASAGYNLSLTKNDSAFTSGPTFEMSEDAEIKSTATRQMFTSDLNIYNPEGEQKYVGTVDIKYVDGSTTIISATGISNETGNDGWTSTNPIFPYETVITVSNVNIAAGYKLTKVRIGETDITAVNGVYTYTMYGNANVEVFTEYDSFTLTVKALSNTVAKSSSYNEDSTRGIVKINSNTAGTSVNQTIAYKSTATISAQVVDSGYQFDGWYTSSDFSGTAVSTDLEYTVEMGTSDITYYAKFSAKTHTITITNPSHGSIGLDINSTTDNNDITPYSSSSTTYTVKEGKTVTFTVTIDAGYSLKSFTDNGTDKKSSISNNSYTISSISANHTLVLTVEKATLTVTFVANKTEEGKVAISSTTKSVTYNSTYGTLPTATRTGYHLNGWTLNLFNDATEVYKTSAYIYKDGVKYNNGEYTIYKAYISPNTKYIITESGRSSAPGYAIYDANGTLLAGASYSGDWQNGTPKTVTFTTPANASYILFSVVTKSENRQDKEYFSLTNPTDYVTASTKVTTTCNHKLIAQMELNTYTIAFNSNGGNGTMSDLAMTYGTAKTLTKNGFTRTGYTFKNWNIKQDGTGTSYADKASVNNLTTENGGTVTLYAQWTESFSITINVNFDSSCDSDTMIIVKLYDLTHGSIRTFTFYRANGASQSVKLENLSSAKFMIMSSTLSKHTAFIDKNSTATYEDDKSEGVKYEQFTLGTTTSATYKFNVYKTTTGGFIGRN